jgi:hypothetical protein
MLYRKASLMSVRRLRRLAVEKFEKKRARSRRAAATPGATYPQSLGS